MNIKKTNIGCIVVMAIFILVGCNFNIEDLKVESKIKTGEDINFYITTDIHYLAEELTDNGEAFKKYVSSGDGKQLEYINEIFHGFSAEVSDKKPNILIVSGDLTNNGEKKSHIELAKQLEEIESNGTSVYVIPGNHDIFNPWARGFRGNNQYVTEHISQKDFSKIYSKLGYDEAILRDKNTLSYLATPSEDLWLLMLDTNNYKNNVRLKHPQTDGEITQGTLEWIKKCGALAKEKGANVITVMHHNVLSHSEVIQKGFTLNNNKEVIQELQSNGLNLVLSGHIHTQDISSYKTDKGTMYDIATGSLAVNPHQYGVLKYTASNTSYEYKTSKINVERWSREVKTADKNINNFKSFSEEYFGKFAYDMAYNQLFIEEGFSEEEMNAMSEVMKILNLRYFAGVENLNSKDVINSHGFKLWLNAPDSFIKRYIMSILEDKDIEDNYLEIQINNETPKDP